MISAIDANILFDILIPDPIHAASSVDRVNGASVEGSLLICDVVYAELAGFFDQASDLDNFLQRNGIEVNSLDAAALFAAGRAWRRYAQQRGTSLACSARRLDLSDPARRQEVTRT